MEARNIAVESLKPVVSDFQHFDDGQNPDPDPGLHQSENSYPDLRQMKSKIRIRIKVNSRITAALICMDSSLNMNHVPW